MDDKRTLSVHMCIDFEENKSDVEQIAFSTRSSSQQQLYTHGAITVASTYIIIIIITVVRYVYVYTFNIIVVVVKRRYVTLCYIPPRYRYTYYVCAGRYNIYV